MHWPVADWRLRQGAIYHAMDLPRLLWKTIKAVLTGGHIHVTRRNIFTASDPKRTPPCPVFCVYAPRVKTTLARVSRVVKVLSTSAPVWPGVVHVLGYTAT